MKVMKGQTVDLPNEPYTNTWRRSNIFSLHLASVLSGLHSSSVHRGKESHVQQVCTSLFSYLILHTRAEAKGYRPANMVMFFKGDVQFLSLHLLLQHLSIYHKSVFADDIVMLMNV